MAVRLVINIANRNYPVGHRAAAQNFQRYQPGHVVDILRAGVNPGRKIWASPKFKIVDVPDMSYAEALTLREVPEFFADEAKGAGVGRRNFLLDYKTAGRVADFETNLTREKSIPVADIRAMRVSKTLARR